MTYNDLYFFLLGGVDSMNSDSLSSSEEEIRRDRDMDVSGSVALVSGIEGMVGLVSP
eukprot:m.230643 g.230643  ORF g.230643 m.230643 type:complete len:57 (+) comp16001_c0_seq5:2401-2571(+)